MYRNNISFVKFCKILVSNTTPSMKQPRLHFSHKVRKPVIACRRRNLDFYENMKYDNLDKVPLASRGWANSKSHGDHFTIIGNPTNRDIPSVPLPLLGISNEHEMVLTNRGVTAFTSFQRSVIPVIRTGKHTLIAAETGCGKTYSYLLPLVEKLKPTTTLNAPQVLVLVPNRELAYQVGAVAASLCEANRLSAKVLVGGRTKQLMLKAEYDCVDVLIATPGAIGKLSTIGLYKLHNVEDTVIDEADTLLDDSFAERMESIFSRVISSRFIFASATLPRKLPALLQPIMSTLVQCKSERLHRPLLNTTQKFLRVSRSTKPSNLLALAKSDRNPMMIFTNRNDTCNWLALFLRENGLNCSNINGDMNYSIRMEQWDDFQSGRTKILSATDIASRGLDTTSLKQIINYDFPLYTADYIHRVGRVGRLGSDEDSKVFNFISGPLEVKLVQNIEMAIRTGSELKYVDGNISSLVQSRIMKKLQGAS